MTTWQGALAFALFLLSVLNALIRRPAAERYLAALMLVCAVVLMASVQAR